MALSSVFYPWLLVLHLCYKYASLDKDLSLSLSLSTVLLLLRTTSESCSEYQSGHCNIKSFKTLQHSSDVKVHLLVQLVLLLILPEKEMKEPVDFQRIIAPPPPIFTTYLHRPKKKKNKIKQKCNKLFLFIKSSGKKFYYTTVKRSHLNSSCHNVVKK